MYVCTSDMKIMAASVCVYFRDLRHTKFEISPQFFLAASSYTTYLIWKKRQERGVSKSWFFRPFVIYYVKCTNNYLIYVYIGTFNFSEIRFHVSSSNEFCTCTQMFLRIAHYMEYVHQLFRTSRNISRILRNEYIYTLSNDTRPSIWGQLSEILFWS